MNRRGRSTLAHLFLRRQAPEYLGIVAFALWAMIAHGVRFTHISLITGGGRGRNPNLIGYFFWPKLRFGAPLEPDETAVARPEFAACSDSPGHTGCRLDPAMDEKKLI
jgi:hypothetical protein